MFLGFFSRFQIADINVSRVITGRECFRSDLFTYIYVYKQIVLCIEYDMLWCNSRKVVFQTIYSELNKFVTSESFILS